MASLRNRSHRIDFSNSTFDPGSLSGIATLVLIATSIGAILRQLPTIGGSPALLIGLLIAVSVVAWGRKETALRLLGCKRS